MRKWLLLVTVLFVPLSLPPFLFAQVHGGRGFLNLGGSIELSYGHIRTKDNGVPTSNFSVPQVFSNSATVDQFQYRLNLRNSGVFLDRRLGSFTVGISSLRQDVNTEGNGRADDKREFGFSDLNVSLNLFPLWSPVTFFFQRVNRIQCPSTFGSHCKVSRAPTIVDVGDDAVQDRVTTFGVSWVLSLKQLPRTSLSFTRSQFEGNDILRLPDTTTNLFHAETSGRLRNSNISLRYQFSDTEVTRGIPAVSLGQVQTTQSTGTDHVQGHAVNVTVDTRVTPSLLLSTYGKITTQGGLSTPGLGFFQENNGGISLSYTPSLFWGRPNLLDANLKYDYVDIPKDIDFQKHIGHVNLNIRPTTSIDLITSYRALLFNVLQSDTVSHFIDISGGWRPLFGVNTGLGFSVGQTDVSGGSAGSIGSQFYRWRYSLNCFDCVQAMARFLQRLQLRSNLGYSVSLFRTKSDLGLSEPRDLVNTVNLSLENTNIRVFRAALSYTYNNIDREDDARSLGVNIGGNTADQELHQVALNVDSRYVGNILMVGDNLSLQGSANLLRINGVGVSSTSILLDARASYFFWRGVSITGGYTRQDFARAFFGDTDLFLGEVQWASGWRNLGWTLSGRFTRLDNRALDSLDRNTITVTPSLSYQAGRFLFNYDYRFSHDDTATIDFETSAHFLRVSRVF